jgi:hypothetical protein
MSGGNGMATNPELNYRAAVTHCALCGQVYAVDRIGQKEKPLREARA